MCVIRDDRDRGSGKTTAVYIYEYNRILYNIIIYYIF